MPESLGVRLRRRREEQQVALSTIAERTKIKMSLLEALERDDVSHWPAGIYRRAFIRSYAAAIGLDPDAIVREFLELYPDPEEQPAEAPPPPAGLRGVFGSALGSLARLGRTPAPEPAPPSRGPVNPRPFDVAPEVRIETFERETSSEVATPPDTSFALPSFEPAAHLVEEVHAAEDDAYPELPTQQGDHTPSAAGAADVPLPAPPAFAADLPAVARVCTGFARVQSNEEIPALLEQMARVLGARGLIAWVWEPMLDGLRPALAYGYSPALLTQLPTVRHDDDNATAAAFRSSEPCAIRGTDDASGALVVPLVTSDGASGALAVELPHGWEQDASVRALAAICAAVLSPLISVPRAEPAPSSEDSDTPPAAFAPAAWTKARR